MATINEQFIQVKTKANFGSRLSAGDIKDTSIAFIEDTEEIWAKQKYYKLVPTIDGTDGQVLTKTSDGVAWENVQAGSSFPEGGTVGQVLKKTSTGVEWSTDNNTTYQKVTQKTDGLMSKEDKTKLDNIEEGANNYVLPATTDEVLGGIKTGYVGSGANYPVKTDSDHNAYVTVGSAIMNKLTQAEYDELETKDSNTIYFIIG